MAGALIGIRSTALLVALLSITAWVTPAGGAVGLKAASPAVRNSAPATPQPVVPLQTVLSAAPGLNIVPIAQLFKSTSRTKVVRPVFRGRAPWKAQPPQTAPVAAGTPRAPLTPMAQRMAVYNSLNQPGLAAGASGLTPPDSTGAIGPAHY